ncbi:MAG: hypothetical protein IPL88_03630 [Rhizobiales bacterium]|nr:hypothetical protein [Hyphomicrobiales bacterium]
MRASLVVLFVRVVIVSFAGLLAGAVFAPVLLRVVSALRAVVAAVFAAALAAGFVSLPARAEAEAARAVALALVLVLALSPGVFRAGALLASLASLPPAALLREAGFVAALDLPALEACFPAVLRAVAIGTLLSTPALETGEIARKNAPGRDGRIATVRR